MCVCVCVCVCQKKHIHVCVCVYIGQKVCLDFSLTSYGKTQMNSLANPVYNIYMCIHIYINVCILLFGHTVMSDSF